MKKVIGILGVIALSTGIFFSANILEASNDIGLASVISLNTADAECPPYTWMGGRCLVLSEVCVGDFWETDCDF